MNNRWGLLALALTIIALGSVVVLLVVPAPKTPIDTATSTIPAATSSAELIANPIAVASTSVLSTGKALGSWYFEASFPVQVLDQNGQVIAQGPAQAQSDWMTTAYVPFKLTLTFAKQPQGSHGMVVFKNDNPSGDPARDKSISVPIVFQ